MTISPMRDGQADKRTTYLSLLFLLLVIILPYWKLATMQGLLITDDIFTSDIMNESFPYRYSIGEALKKGEMPLWLPHIYGGIPLLARAEAGVCYPPNLILFGLLPPHVALNSVILLTLITAALAMYFYAREVGTSNAGALIASIGYAYSGFMVSHLKHLSTVGTVCWFPFGLLVIERAIQRNQARSLLWLGGVIGMQNLSGHTQTAYYSGLVYLAYFFLRVWGSRRQEFQQKRRGKANSHQSSITQEFSFKKHGAWFVLALLVGVALSAVQLLPTYELVQLTQRSGGVTFDYASQYSYDPSNFKTFFYPAANGEISKATYTGNSIFWEDYGYVGVVTVLLALFAVASSWRTWHVRFFTGAAVIAYVFVLGPNTPLYRVAFDLVPGMNYFRFPTRFLFVVGASLSLLAGFGLTRLRSAVGGGKADRPHSSRIGRVEWALLVVVVADLLFFQLRQNAIVDTGEWLAIPKTVEKLREDRSLFRIYSPAASETHKAAFAVARGWEGSLKSYVDQREFVQPSSNVLYDIFSADGYAQLTPNYVVDLWGDQNRAGIIMKTASLREGAFVPKEAFLKIMNMCNVKYVLSPWPCDTDVLRSVGQIGPVFMYQNPFVLPRAFLVRSYVIARNQDAAKALILSDDFDPSKEVILYEEPAIRPDTSVVHCTATVESYSTNEVIVKVSTEADRLLVLSDTFYPGWRAEVDAKVTRMIRGNLYQRVVGVPKGDHVVRFVFEAPTATTGLAVTILGAILLVAGLVGVKKQTAQA